MKRPGSRLQGRDDGADTRLRNLFAVRALVVLGFAASIALIPELGDDRGPVALGVLLVVPYNLAGPWFTRRAGRLPLGYPVTDTAIAAAVAIVLPEVWAVSLLVMVSSLALAATERRLRALVPVTAFAIVAALVVSVDALDGWHTVIAAIGFTGAAVLTVVPTGLAAQRSRALLAENEDLLDNMDAIAWTLETGADRYRSLSSGAQRLLGYPQVKLFEVDFWLEHVHPDDRAAVATTRRSTADTGSPAEVDYRMVDGAGRWHWLREVVAPETDGGGPTTHLRGITLDVSERRSTEEERALYHHVVQHIDSAIVVSRIDPSRNNTLVVVAANPSAGTLFGSPPSQLVGLELAEVLGPMDDSVLLRARAVAAGGEAFTVERVDGLGIDRQKTFAIQAFSLPNDCVGFSIDDVTGAAMVAAALRRQALHDGLTGLPNRTLLRDRLRYAVADAKRRDERVALILLDLNHFKEVNDALGHQYGDRLLTAFARRLQHLLRECDTIARLGGDEFALLLTHATNDGASRVVEKVTEAMQEPFELDGVTVQTTASLGVALFPDHASDADLLTQRADVAMYAAKRGGGGWSVYSPAQDQSSIERLTLLTDLHHELDELPAQSMSVHYQPLYDLGTNRIVGSEALLRWQHPTMGWLNPEMVVELAELSGLIGNLGRFVAREAMSTTNSWRRRGHDLSVAINLSARNLYDRNLSTWLTAIMAETGLPATALKCELTESEVMDDPVLAMDVISELRERGIRTAIDDFGTGYSSLAYLRRLPVDEIKIDKSFVMNMMGDRNDLMIVRTVVDLAHNLGMSVLAEGVEDEETLDALREFGCDRVQGYLIGRPMPASAFLGVMEERTAVGGP